MRPISLTIKGVGPYRAETTIDVASLASPIAIVGPYGSGKSWVLESILFALWSKGGWYSSGSIYDIQTQGGDGESYIHLTFEHDGKTFRIERHINKGHTAHVYRGEQILAGPKVGDVASWVEAHIGTWETAASTWFLSQSRSNDLCGTPGEKDLVARRRAVFNELLGIADLDAEAERMRAERAKCLAQVEMLEAQLAEGDATEEVEIRRETLIAARSTLVAAEALLKQAEQHIVDRRADAEAAVIAGRAFADELKATKAQIQEMERIIAEEHKLDGRVYDLSRRVDELDGAEAQVEALEYAMRLRSEMLPQLEARQAWETAQAEYERAVAHQEALRREIEALRGSLPDAETVALAGQAAAIEKAFFRISAANLEAQGHNERLDVQRRTIELALAASEAECERIRKRIQQKPVTPFGDDCAPCPLMQEWASLPGALLEALSELGCHHFDLENLPSPAPMPDMAPLHREAAQAQEALRAVQRGEASKTKVDALQRDLCDPGTPGPPPADPRAAIAGYQASIEALAGAPAKLEAQGQARKDLAEAQLELSRIAPEASKSKEALPTKKAAVAFLSRQTQEAQHKAEMAAADLKDAEAGARRRRAEAQTYHADVGRAEASLEAAEARAKAQALKREQVQTLTVRRGALDDLVVCFGPRGVRQILVDAAAPELEDIADQLFETGTEGRMRLRIATQKVLKDGSVVEDFSIMIRDQAGERDVVQHSGGEIQLCSILFRIAVAMWVARLKGQKPEVLMLDEAFDRLGQAGAEDLLRVLGAMADRIGCIVVITHDEAIANRLRSQVRVVKSFSGSRVEV